MSPIGGGRATAFLWFSNNGALNAEWTGQPAGAFSLADQWVVPQTHAAAELYEMMATLVSGDFSAAPAFGVWHPLNVTRTFSQDRVAVGTWSGQARVDIRLIGSTTIEATGLMTVSVQVL